MIPMDLSKFRREITKNIEGMSIGFHDPKTWISINNYCLNYLISGDFNKGIPLGKVTIFAGQSGSGKSLICSGNVIKNAQDQDIFVVLIDSENALDESWLQALGVDTSPDKLLKLNMAMVNDVALTISTFMNAYRALPMQDRTKILFVIDSLGMLLTPVAKEQFDKGELKGDMGHLPKALKALIKNCVNMFGEHEVGLLATNHTYDSQDMYNPDQIISGGSGPIFAASIVVAMKLMKLKEDEDGNKTKTVNGIRAGCKIMKTRYNKPFETMEVQIPYETGILPYSGLFDFFERKGLLTKEGNSYIYTFVDGTQHKSFRKKYEKNEDGILDKIMEDFTLRKESETFNNIIEEPEDE